MYINVKPSYITKYNMSVVFYVKQYLSDKNTNTFFFTVTVTFQCII